MGLDADEQHGESLGILVARLQELHDLEARCIDGLRDLLEEAAVRGADDA